jgi:hypothetical protein
MPGVARGESAWNSEEADHLAACADCGAEWRLVRGAMRLGDSESWTADPDALTSAVLTRLRASRARQGHMRRWRQAASGIAAAAVLVLLVWGLGRSTARPHGGSAVRELSDVEMVDAILPGLDSLSEGALDAVLDGLGGPSLESEIDWSPPDLESLDSTGLAMVLNGLEGT